MFCWAWATAAENGSKKYSAWAAAAAAKANSFGEDSGVSTVSIFLGLSLLRFLAANGKELGDC